MNVFNLATLELADTQWPREGHELRRRSLTREVGAQRTGFSVYELPPGTTGWAYHWELNREEILFVVEGELVLRTPAGERELRAGDIAWFAAGPGGAHQVRNGSSATARFAIPASWDGHVVAIRPDSNTMLVSSEDYHAIVSLDEQLSYWDREP